MSVQVDIWLRGENHATTREIEGAAPDPAHWTDDDVRTLLEGMLREMDRQKHRDQGDRQIVLRGLSWIVNPYEDGGVVLAIEIGLGAAVAGPFDIERKTLEDMVARVLAGPPGSGSSSVH